MFYVYILRSIDFPEKIYIGMTQDLSARLNMHNSGKSIHTDKFKPWKIVGYVSFDGKDKAAKFEKYLKSGSGRAFMKKHFL